MPSGGVTRRGESWRARYRHPETGRQIQRTYRRQVDAQRWLREQMSAVDSGRWVDPRHGKVTFDAYFEAWAQRQVWATNTAKTVSVAVRSTTFRTLPLARIQPGHIEQWIKSMSVATPTRDRPLAASTVKARFVNIRTVFKAAIRDGYLIKDPTEGVRLPRQRKREAAMTIPTPVQVRAILEAADERFTALVALAAFAGLRLGEAAAVQTGDIDFLRRELHVRRQVQRSSAGVEITPPKFGSERVVPLPDAVLEILARHIELGHRGPWLFAGHRDVPPHQNDVGYVWRKTVAAAGLSGIKLHNLRHFFASGLIASGLDVVAVQRALGHAKASTTLSVYSHLWPTAEDRTRTASAAVVDQVLGANVGNMRAGGGAQAPDQQV